VSIDFAALNSATKYPLIPTYHTLEGGRLTESPMVYPPGDPVTLTEKIHGTSARIAQLPGGDYVIGNRNTLLHAKGDRIPNMVDGVVTELMATAASLTLLDDDTWVRVFYFEVYGGRIGPWAKQYTGLGTVGHRLFDVAYIPLDVLEETPADIAAWRDAGGQLFANEATLQRAARAESLALVPRLGTVSADSLPVTLEGMHEWLRSAFPMGTFAPLDDGGKDKPEGIVLRTTDRGVITKARFEDYEKIFGTMPKTAKN
jgi:hypothetical protein